MSTLIREEFEVSGMTPFPIDMLRYDGCFPADEQQSARIAESVCGAVPMVTIRLARHTRQGQRPVTSERWQSFGWQVDARSLHRRRL